MKYRIAGFVLGVLGIGFAGLGLYCFVVLKPSVHLVSDGSHYRINIVWIGGWSLYVSFLSWVGSRYCINRSASRKPGRVDGRLIAAGKWAVVLGFIILALYLMTPTILT